MRTRYFFIFTFLLAINCSLFSQGTPRTGAPASMEWWREARFGMFIHWGLYAVPAGEWNPGSR